MKLRKVREQFMRCMGVCGICLLLVACHKKLKVVSANEQYLSVMEKMDSTLYSLQEKDRSDKDFGGIYCPHCGLYHTRAAEAMYPFAWEYKVTGNKKYLTAAINLGNWLIRQQFSGGYWEETPEKWTGTTADQLLMMSLTYPIVQDHLVTGEEKSWRQAMTAAGDYLVKVMSPEFASINYVATTSATLMALNAVFPDSRYTNRARVLARKVSAKMDDDYFITGEGGRVFGEKYGVDLGYNMEMSLWGLGLYARLAKDDEVLERVKKSIITHLNFIYPNGGLDGSWGIRSNKWTCYGGATSDGVQVLFSLFAKEDDRYRTAALRNLHFLESCMTNGLVGYGPQYPELFNIVPCIYPTFAKAKNLAMAQAFNTADKGPLPPLPTDLPGIHVFSTINVAVVRTADFCATVTAYGYQDPKGIGSKYMYRPAGGAISALWLKGYGYLQASSQTEYHRWEPMHFPEAKGLKSLTPRIEFSNSNGYFTNLYEFGATTRFVREKEGATVFAYGELKDKYHRPGGIGYSYQYRFKDKSLIKTVHLRFHDARDTVRIVEPVIDYAGVTFKRQGEKSVSITKGGRHVRFTLIKGDAQFSEGKDADRYWSPYPALKAFPLVLTVVPEKGKNVSDIEYAFCVQQE